MDEPNQIGSWKKVSVLGTGGFGTVSHWICEETKQNIAIKKCKRSPMSLSEKQKMRWIKEVTIMKKTNHPNIVSYQMIPSFLEETLMQFNPSRLPLLPMEFCSKGNLRQMLLDPLNCCGLKENIVKFILSDISSAISYLHSQSITHRDIKPENIVLQSSTSRKNNFIYKVIDLGYAKEFGDATISFVGTLFYLAPEIFAGMAYNYSVDYWSLGVLAFEIICGEIPFLKTLNNFERFKYLKEKGPKNICVYKNIHGNIAYSEHLFNENYLLSSFQNNIEVWIQKALQFDPENRTKMFENNQSFFDYLQNILNKKQVNVFCVFQCKQMSYDLDSFKNLMELKLCIEKDMQIKVEDQVLVSSNNDLLLSDLDRCFAKKEELWLYLFSKNRLFESKINNILVPRKIKYMFDNISNNFTMEEIKSITVHAIFFIKTNLHQTTHISKALFFLRKAFQFELNKCLESNKVLTIDVKFLLGHIETFENVKKNIEFDNFNEKCRSSMKTHLLQYHKILENSENIIIKKNKLDKQLKCLNDKKTFLEDMFPQICEKINMLEIHDLLKKASQILKTFDLPADLKTYSITEIFKIVNRSIKIHDLMLRNEDLRAYAVYMQYLFQKVKEMHIWLTNFSCVTQKTQKSLLDFMEDFEKLTKNSNDFEEVSSVNVSDMPQPNYSFKSTVSDNVDVILPDDEKIKQRMFEEELKEFCNKFLKI